MADFTEYAANMPCWTDLSTNDLQGAIRFYTGLFGWTANSNPNPAAGGYTICTLDGKTVAGIGPQMNSQAPPMWNTVINVEDADKTVELVLEAGGQVVAPPMEVMGEGRLAVCMDPCNAVVMAWQPRKRKGAEVANEPNTWCWNELQPRDITKSENFYQDVFGWETKDVGNEEMPYAEIQLDGRVIAGMIPMPLMVPSEVPSYWLTYFAVDDCMQRAEEAIDLGAKLLVEPREIPQGVFAVAADPQGATFAIVQFEA